MIFCGTASAGMNCQVTYPNGVLSDNALQDLFAYAVVTADIRKKNRVFMGKIVKGLKPSEIKSYEDGFTDSPAYEIFTNHAAVQPELKASATPCAPSKWTSYAPTLFYYLAVKKQAMRSTNGQIYGMQVAAEYGHLVTAFNKVVNIKTQDKTKDAAHGQKIEACLDRSGWNTFIHGNPHTPIYALERAVKRGDARGISGQERVLRNSSLQADRYAVAALDCAH